MFSSLGYTKVKVLFRVERNPIHSCFHCLRVWEVPLRTILDKGQFGWSPWSKTLKCCLSEPSLFPKLAVSLVLKFAWEAHGSKNKVSLPHIEELEPMWSQILDRSIVSIRTGWVQVSQQGCWAQTSTKRQVISSNSNASYPTNQDIILEWEAGVKVFPWETGYS